MDLPARGTGVGSGAGAAVRGLAGVLATSGGLVVVAPRGVVAAGTVGVAGVAGGTTGDAVGGTATAAGGPVKAPAVDVRVGVATGAPATAGAFAGVGAAKTEGALGALATNGAAGDDGAPGTIGAVVAVLGTIGAVALGVLDTTGAVALGVLGTIGAVAFGVLGTTGAVAVGVLGTTGAVAVDTTGAVGVGPGTIGADVLGTVGAVAAGRPLRPAGRPERPDSPAAGREVGSAKLATRAGSAGRVFDCVVEGLVGGVAVDVDGVLAVVVVAVDVDGMLAVGIAAGDVAVDVAVDVGLAVGIAAGDVAVGDVAVGDVAVGDGAVDVEGVLAAVDGAAAGRVDPAAVSGPLVAPGRVGAANMLAFGASLAGFVALAGAATRPQGGDTTVLGFGLPGAVGRWALPCEVGRIVSCSVPVSVGAGASTAARAGGATGAGPIFVTSLAVGRAGSGLTGAGPRGSTRDGSTAREGSTGRDGSTARGGSTLAGRVTSAAGLAGAAVVLARTRVPSLGPGRGGGPMRVVSDGAGPGWAIATGGTLGGRSVEPGLLSSGGRAGAGDGVEAGG